jgi:hypothetical protein
VCGTLGELLEVDFGAPLHCLVIVGETHPVEKEVRFLVCRQLCYAHRGWACLSNYELLALGITVQILEYFRVKPATA